MDAERFSFLRNLNREPFLLLLRLGRARTGRSHVVGNGLILVEANVTGIGTNKSFVENAAGELLKLLFFEGAKQTGPDLRGERDVVERDATLFPLLFQTIAEGSHCDASS